LAITDLALKWEANLFSMNLCFEKGDCHVFLPFYIWVNTVQYYRRIWTESSFKNKNKLNGTYFKNEVCQDPEKGFKNINSQEH